MEGVSPADQLFMHVAVAQDCPIARERALSARFEPMQPLVEMRAVVSNNLKTYRRRDCRSEHGFLVTRKMPAKPICGICVRTIIDVFCGFETITLFLQRLRLRRIQEHPRGHRWVCIRNAFELVNHQERAKTRIGEVCFHRLFEMNRLCLRFLHPGRLHAGKVRWQTIQIKHRSNQHCAVVAHHLWYITIHLPKARDSTLEVRSRLNQLGN